MSVRTQPCSACPYRCDVPSGIWAARDYDKLPDYDKLTAEQPRAAFSCHATPENYCHGWAVAHTSRGQAYELLALRLAAREVVIPPASVELFSSGAKAAEHGKRDIENPSPEAFEAVEKLSRKYDRLRYA